MKSGKTYYLELVNGMRQTAVDRCLLAVLQLLSIPYALVMSFRSLGYRYGIIRSRKLPVPVISVGNLTTGGTGKTPTVAWLARYLMGKGRRVAVLSRGYGGSAEGQIRIVADGETLLLSPDVAGDEPCLLAQSVPGLMVVTGTDRYRAGLHAMAQLAPDLFILDDGFQHQRLKRDLDILLLDCRRPFANGWMLPAGLLREPVSAAGRADMVILTRCHEKLEKPAIPAGTTCCVTTHRLTGLIPLAGGPQQTFSSLDGETVLAFAGIAEPSAFFAALEAVGVQLAATLVFPDHVSYDKEVVAEICRRRDAFSVSCLVTTAKDGVKLSSVAAELGCCYTTVLELEFADSGPLEQALKRVVRFHKA